MDHRAFFCAPSQPVDKEKVHISQHNAARCFRPDRDRRVQGASHDARARSAVPPSIAFEQPQTADGKSPSGQAAAGQTYKHNLIEGVAFKDTQSSLDLVLVLSLARLLVDRPR